MGRVKSFEAIFTTANGSKRSAEMYLVGETNMFFCKFIDGSFKFIPANELLFLLGDQRLDFKRMSDRRKFADAMDIAIASSVWLNRTREKALRIGGIVVGSAIVIVAAAKIIPLVVSAYSSASSK